MLGTAFFVLPSSAVPSFTGPLCASQGFAYTLQDHKPGSVEFLNASSTTAAFCALAWSRHGMFM